MGLLSEMLTDIETSIQSFYLIVDGKRGSEMISRLSELKLKQIKLKEKMENKNNKNVNPDDPDGILTETDKELLEFADTLPKEIEIPDEFKNVGKFILPTMSKEEFVNTEVEVLNGEEEQNIELGIHGLPNSRG